MNVDERRKHKRYDVKEGAFAALPSNYLVGQIKNISKGGISFTCLSSGKQKFNMPILEIFSKDNDFYLREIPFKIVSEIDVEDRVPSSSIQMKQIGGEFVNLTEDQKSQLDYFLQLMEFLKIVYLISLVFVVNLIQCKVYQYMLVVVTYV